MKSQLGRQRTTIPREYVRELRTRQTLSESRLWQHLRNRRLHGTKFRRQYAIGPYVLDFYCPEYRLAIELDGSQHHLPDQIASDKLREMYFKREGIQVLRFNNNDVLRSVDAVLRAILDILNDTD